MTLFAPPKLRELHYLYTRKTGARIVAHCLDLDIVTAAGDIDEAERRLDLLVIAQIEEALSIGNYSALATAAPGSYWNLFNDAMRSGKMHVSKNPVLSIRIPDVVPLKEARSSIGVLAAMAA